MSDDIAISSALSIMDKCGLQLEGNPDMRNTVEPPKCPICKAYIWPHEEKTGDKHKRCYDGVVFKSQANR